MASRISVVTTIGAGDSMNQAPFAFKLLMTVMTRSADKNKQERLLNGPGGDLEYCIVRPGGLNKDPPNGIVNVIDGQAGSIARADVAAFCLDAVLEPDFKFIKQTPYISSDKGAGFDSVLADGPSRAWASSEGSRGILGRRYEYRKRATVESGRTKCRRRCTARCRAHHDRAGADDFGHAISHAGPAASTCT